MHTDALAVLDFWFGPPDDPGHAQPRAMWFTKDDAFDARIAQRFGPLIARALVGGIDDWLTRPVDPLPALAQVLVLDQFTRNVFSAAAPGRLPATRWRCRLPGPWWRAVPTGP